MIKQSSEEAIQSNPTLMKEHKSGWRRHLREELFILLALLVLLLLILLLFLPSATVTISPVQKAMSNSPVIYAVTGTPDAQKLQVQARMLSVTEQGLQTVNASGKAVQAKGTVTIYNYTPEDKFIPAHTRFTDKRGVQYETVQAITVDPPPGGQPGFASVAAQAVQAGEHGNSQSMKEADTLDTELTGQLKGVWVVNAGSFTGGQDLVVLQSDIDRATKALTERLLQEAKVDMTKLPHPNETFVDDPQYTSKTTADHKSGDTQVTVTGTVIGSGEVYDRQAALTLSTNLLKQKASTELGKDYLLAGNVAAAISQAHVMDKTTGTIELLVPAHGTWAFHLSDTRKAQLAQRIAGKNVTEAKTMLLQESGIHDVTIVIHGGDAQTLPFFSQRIDMR